MLLPESTVNPMSDRSSWQSNPIFPIIIILVWYIINPPIAAASVIS